MGDTGEIEFIAPSLDDIGHILWGANWREHLAHALDVSEDDVTIWATEPAQRPSDLEDNLQRVGLVRIQEIAFMMGHLKHNGLRTGEE